MNPPCHHAQVSYSVWRLGVFRTLAASYRTRFELQCDFLFPALSSSRLRSNDTRRHFSGSDRGQIPRGRPIDGSLREKDGYLLENARRRAKTSRMKPAGSHVQDLPNPVADPNNKVLKHRANSESHVFSQYEATAAHKPRLADGMRSRTDLSKHRTESNSSPGLATINEDHAKKLRQTPWSPYKTAGREDLKALITDLKEAVREAEHGDVPFEPFKRLSDALPKSPILLRAKTQRTLKYRPPKSEPENLASNPWAVMLASPVRQCQATGVKIPCDLLLSWGFVRNPNDGQTYLMPDKIANFQQFGQNAVNRVVDISSDEYSDGSEDLGLALEGGCKNLPIVETVRYHNSSVDSSAEHDDSSSSSPESRISNHLSTPSKLWMLPLFSLMRHLTSYFVGGPDSKGVRHTNKDKLLKMLPERWKDAIDAAAARVKMARHSRQSIQGLYGEMNVDISSDKPDYVASREGLGWQLEIDMRLQGILQRRVLAALEKMAHKNNGENGENTGLFRRIHALSLPAAECYSSYMTEERSHGPDEVACEEHHIRSSAEHPTRSDQYGHIPGSIFLYMGPDEVPQNLHFDPNTHQILRQKSSSLEDSANNPSRPRLLPSHPMIPTTITIKNSLRAPVFSLQHLIGEDGATQFRALADRYAILAAPQVSTSPLDPTREDGAEIDATNRNSNSESPYLLLIPPKASSTAILIQEIWRLWRYVGGYTSPSSARHRKKYSGDIFDYQRLIAAELAAQVRAVSATLENAPGADCQFGSSTAAEIGKLLPERKQDMRFRMRRDGSGPSTRGARLGMAELEQLDQIKVMKTRLRRGGNKVG